MSQARTSCVALRVRVGLALAWVCLLTVLFGQSAWVALTSLGQLGMRQALPGLGLIVAAAGGWAVLYRLRRTAWRRGYAYVLMGGASLVILISLTMGQALVPASLVLYFTWLGWALGEAILQRLFRAGTGPVGIQRIVYAVGIGFGMFSHAMLALALLGGLSQPPLIGLLVGLTLALWRTLSHSLRQLGIALRGLAAQVSHSAWGAHHWFTSIGVTLGCGWLLLVYIQAVAPEIQYDALNYHLTLPKIYIEAGRFVTTPHIVQSWFALGAEMNFLLTMLLTNQIAAKLWNALWLILLLGLTFTVARALFSKMTALYSLLLLATAPVLAWEASTTYVELSQSCFCLLGVAAIYYWLTQRQVGWLVMVGLCTGFAVSTKVNSALFLAPFGLVLVGALVVRGRAAPRPALKEAAVLSGVTLLAAAPWPLLRFMQTGNPVFPFLNAVFKSPLWPARNESLNFASYGLGASPANLLRLPWAMTFESGQFIEAMPGGVIGLGILLVPLLILCAPLSRRVLFLLGPLLVFSVTWALSAQALRFYLPALPLIYILVGYSLHRLTTLPHHPGWRAGLTNLARGWLLLYLAAVLPIFAAMYWNIPERIPYQVALGLETHTAYLSRTVASYDAYQYINQTHTEGRSHTLAIWDEFRLYSNGTVSTIHAPALALLFNPKSPSEALRLLRQEGITHILINRNFIPDTLLGLLVIQPAFLEANTQLVYTNKNVSVYRMLSETDKDKSGPTRPLLAEELAVNPGFENLGQAWPLGWQPYGTPSLGRANGQSHSGQVAIQASADSGFIQSVPINPGQLYVLRHYSRLAADASSVRVQINWVDETHQILDVALNVWPATQEWTLREVTSRAPSQARYAVIFANAHSGRVWLDDVSFTPKP